MPVNGWNDKRERRIEHIKRNLTEHQTAEDKAPQIAARTVDKVKVLKGQAKPGPNVSKYDLSARPPGTRSRKTRPLEQLYREAKELGIHGRSDMNKQELQREVERKKRQ
ncbi:MAG: Rho termination factor N-terminal domain-containing protein [Actinomycetota bacterium]